MLYQARDGLSVGQGNETIRPKHLSRKNNLPGIPHPIKLVEAEPGNPV